VAWVDPTGEGRGLGDRELDSPSAAAAFSGEPHFGALRWFAMRPREYLIGSSDCGGIPGFYDDTLHIAADPKGGPSLAEPRCDDDLRFGPCRAVGADRPDRGAPTARDRSRWRLTRPATPAISAWSCASGLTRTSRRTTAGGVRRLMAVPPGTPDMRSPSGPASASREPSPGPVHVAFDGGRMTSDAGILVLAAIEQQLGIYQGLGRSPPDAVSRLRDHFQRRITGLSRAGRRARSDHKRWREIGGGPHSRTCASSRGRVAAAVGIRSAPSPIFLA
jgi:hypothetical protein